MSSRNIGADCSRSTGSIVSTLIDIRTLPQTLISLIVVADLLFNLEPDKRFVETYYSAKVHNCKFYNLAKTIYLIFFHN